MWSNIWVPYISRYISRYISLLDVPDQTKKVHFVRQITLGLNNSWLTGRWDFGSSWKKLYCESLTYIKGFENWLVEIISAQRPYHVSTIPYLLNGNSPLSMKIFKHFWAISFVIYYCDNVTNVDDRHEFKKLRLSTQTWLLSVYPMLVLVSSIRSERTFPNKFIPSLYIDRTRCLNRCWNSGGIHLFLERTPDTSTSNGWKAHCMPFEIGACGFVCQRSYGFMRFSFLAGMLFYLLRISRRGHGLSQWPLFETSLSNRKVFHLALLLLYWLPGEGIQITSGYKTSFQHHKCLASQLLLLP